MKENLVSITELRDTERRVLNYMLLSKDNFIEICDRLDKDDFIFFVHKIIFQYFTSIFKGIIISCMNDKLEEALEACTEFVVEKHNLMTMEVYLSKEYCIEPTLVLSELAEAPSTDVKGDISIIEAYSFEKAVGKSSQESEVDIRIDTKDGITKLTFMKSKLIGILSTNLNSVPVESCSNFLDTMRMVSEVDLKSDNNELKVKFTSNEKKIVSMHLKKGIVSN